MVLVRELGRDSWCCRIVSGSDGRRFLGAETGATRIVQQRDY